MNDFSYPSEYIVSLENVSHLYGDSYALEDINLDIPYGCMTALIGPDGVGKSTLLSIMSGVRTIQKGNVNVLGGDIKNDKYRDELYKRIAYMPQGLGKNLYKTLSAYENLDFFGRLFGIGSPERKKRIEKLLKTTDLYQFADRPMENLSGGMKQKLGLCCALIHEPDLLILDEPTTGVDPLSRRHFWELIEQIREERADLAVIVATAYMEEAEEFDFIIAMDEGKILAKGSPEELKTESNSYTLEETFINLLPEEKKRKHKKVVIKNRTSAEGSNAIEARNLTKKFRDFTAVNNVSFTIEKGEIFGFVGSNGCGKTTTMKMLTGLLGVTEGEIELFGRPPDSSDIELRRKVGYMSQSFSLYSELTVQQNLQLHARLFHLPEEEIESRIDELISRMGLEKLVSEQAGGLPLGIKQRLSLAVAIIHYPEILILDEPTSGVDPVARDRFWQLLADLSREKGVTIFISTHFMNEAERCDRLSLMHAGRVLATGTPDELTTIRNAADLEDAFVSYLEEAENNDQGGIHKDQSIVSGILAPASLNEGSGGSKTSFSGFKRFWAFMYREYLELTRDPVRLLFALAGPLILLVVFGYGISFDVENLPYSVLDRDRSMESRIYKENYSGSRYFEERGRLENYSELEKRLKSGELRFAIEIPPGYGEDLKSGNKPVIGAWLEGGFPYRAELTRNYIIGVHSNYTQDLLSQESASRRQQKQFNIQTRYRYNQDLESAFAIVPGIIAMLLSVIPSILTAVGVVREKELGSITNLYATPSRRIEFLAGKQMPYILIGLVNFFSFLVFSYWLFNVPVKGSFPSLMLGALIFIAASTGFGLLVSVFTSTQIAALVGTFLITMINSMMFSGFLQPVSSLVGLGKYIALTFPTTYFMKISMGIFTKGLGFRELMSNYIYLLMFLFLFLVMSTLLLRKQEK